MSTAHVTLGILAVAGVVAGVAMVPTAGAIGPGGESVAQVDDGDNATSISFTRQPSDGQTVLIDEVTLPSGGFVAVHDTRFEPPESDPVASVIGVSRYLSAGTHTNVTVTLAEPVNDTDENRVLAVPHNDTDADRLFDFVVANGTVDGPYDRNGTVVTDPASLDLQAGIPPAAVVEFPNQTVNGSIVVVRSATLSRGGFVAISDETGSIIGASGYLPPWTVRNVTIELERVPNGSADLVARAHRDTDADRVFGYPFAEAQADPAYVTEGIPSGVSSDPVARARVTVPTNETATETA